MNEEISQTAACESVILTDSAGNDLEFDVMDAFSYNGCIYYVLLPTDEIGVNAEYLILRETKDSETGESLLEGFDDAELLETVFSEYKKRHISVE